MNYFKEIVVADTEWAIGDDGLPHIHCWCWRELIAGRVGRLWIGDGPPPRICPFDTGPDTLFVAFFASAEMGAFLACGWPMPQCIVCLYAESRAFENAVSWKPEEHPSLLRCLMERGLDCMGIQSKEDMRARALRGAPWAAGEPEAMMNYCMGDVDATARLFIDKLQEIDWPAALFRGRFMRAVAVMERAGIPMDEPLHARFVAACERIIPKLIARLDHYGVWVDGHHSYRAWEAMIDGLGISWPRTPTGKLRSDKKTVERYERDLPQLADYRELKSLLKVMQPDKKTGLRGFPVYADDRCRFLISPFGAQTGRNTPSSKSPFGASVAMRGFIKPPPGHALAYIDWRGQEFAILAKLSGDEAMMSAYRSGDVYRAFARVAGALEPDGEFPPDEKLRQLFKSIVLGIGYGMGADGLGRRIDAAKQQLGIGHNSIDGGRLGGARLLRTYAEAWPVAHQWLSDTVCTAMSTLRLETRLGWTAQIVPTSDRRSIQNFPIQGHGAAMMMLAACFMTEARLDIVCAPVHDAFLICAPEHEIEAVEAFAKDAMERASEIVIGFKIDAKPKTIRYPDRYEDPRAVKHWEILMELLHEVEND